MGVVMVNNVKKIIAYTGAKLLQPCASNVVVLHCWSPGYMISKEVIEPNGAKKIKKIFVPTSTFEAAIAYLKTEYGAKEYLKFKEDAHPGHVSVETKNAYLSVGTEDGVRGIGVQTQHPICFTENFELDLLGFLRQPETILDFYTLDYTLTERAINELKNSQLIYSLLGKRLFKKEGESCATSAFVALEAGGIENLLHANQWLLTKHGILTPSLLTSYCQKARLQEQMLFSESTNLSHSILKQKSDYAEQLLINYTRNRTFSEDSDIPEEPSKRGPSK